MGEKNRHFSREFKRDAVQLVTKKGMPIGKVPREFDIHLNLLHLWRREFSPSMLRNQKEVFFEFLYFLFGDPRILNLH